MSPKAIEIKTKINKWDLIKLTSFGQQRKPVKQTNKQTNKKKQPKEGEKIVANNATEMRSISKIYKQPI